MPAHRRVYLFLLLILPFVPSWRAQALPADHSPKPNPQDDCGGFRVTVETSNWRQSELHGGCLTLGDASVHLDPPPVDFQITDLDSMEKKNLHGLKGFRFKLKNGNKVVFYPLSHDLAAIEKAIRDMASQHGVVLK